MSQESNDEVRLPVVWPLAHDLPTLPANQFAISHTPDGVYLSFGELRPFVITGEEAQHQFEKLVEQGEVQVRPLATVFVSELGFQALLRLMVNTLEADDLEDLAQYITNRLSEPHEME